MTEEDELEEQIFDNLLMAVMFFGILVAMMPVFVHMVMLQFGSRVEVLTASPLATAGNVGRMWLLEPRAGFPGELRIISENSTGAFEQVLIGLST